MKLILTFIICIFSFAAFAGGNSGSGGTRPGMGLFMAMAHTEIKTPGFSVHELSSRGTIFKGGSQVGTLNEVSSSVDFVKAIEFDNSGKAVFKYKGFDSSEIVTHAVDVSDFNENYLAAIKKSLYSKEWEHVSAESLGN